MKAETLQPSEKWGFREKRKLSSQALSCTVRRLACLLPSLKPALCEAGVSAATARGRNQPQGAGGTCGIHQTPAGLCTLATVASMGPRSRKERQRLAAALLYQLSGHLPGSPSNVSPHTHFPLLGHRHSPLFFTPVESSLDLPCCTSSTLLRSHLSPQPGKRALAPAPPLAQSRGSVNSPDTELTPVQRTHFAAGQMEDREGELTVDA